MHCHAFRLKCGTGQRVKYIIIDDAQLIFFTERDLYDVSAQSMIFVKAKNLKATSAHIGKVYCSTEDSLSKDFKINVTQMTRYLQRKCTRSLELRTNVSSKTQTTMSRFCNFGVGLPRTQDIIG